MNRQIIAEFKNALPEFREMTDKFYQKEISMKDYKGFSGKYGSYAQRGGEASMLRLRLNGGQITKDKLKFIADSIDKFRIDKIHFTTCQTIQLHNLTPEMVYELVEAAIDHGIITWGGGGDFPRNVMVSPLSGVEKGEYFDVLPYAQAAADYLLGMVHQVKMPRKLKVCFSNSPANVPHATFRDLGFAATEDGKFDVYSAGGLGNHPKMGLCVAKGIEPDQILYYIQAMIDTFVAYGNYESRAKARTRYMQDTLGEEGYVKAYQEKLEQVLKSSKDLELKIETTEIDKRGDGTQVSDKRAFPQKQEGLYTVVYHPMGGIPNPKKMGELYAVIKDMDQVELRLSPDESLYIINCTGSEAEKVLQATSDGVLNQFEASVSCIGASICQVGVRDSQALLAKLVEESRKHNFADGVLPQIHISGCPSSCGTHQIGRIGFHGGVKVIDKVPNPAFTLHVGGSDREGMEQFGESLGVMLERDIPTFLMAVGEEVSNAGTVFDQWYEANEEKFREIAFKYLQ